MKFDDLQMCRITKTNIIKAQLQKKKKMYYNLQFSCYYAVISIDIKLDCDQLILQWNYCFIFYCIVF